MNVVGNHPTSWGLFDLSMRRSLDPLLKLLCLHLDHDRPISSFGQIHYHSPDVSNPEVLICVYEFHSGNRLGIWDTESDGRGGTHTLAKTREWNFKMIKSEDVIRYLNDVGYDANAGPRVRKHS